MDLSKVSCVNSFVTKILMYNWEDSEKLNAELRKIILEKEKNSKGLKVSNAGSFHSENDFITWPGEAVNTLKNRFIEMCQIAADMNGLEEGVDIKLTFAAWANVVRSGQYHIIHNHPNNHWSCVYYVDTGEKEETTNYNGCIEFHDPRPGAGMINHEKLSLSNRYYVNPDPGLMILFPSFLEHYVHPFFGKGERISVALNAKIL